MKKVKILTEAFSWLILAGLVIIAGLMVMATLKIPGSFQLLTVLSGSMSPTIKTGSIVVVKPAAEYQVGEIITYRLIGQGDHFTHRVVEIKRSGDQKLLVTKGDANQEPDSQPVPMAQVEGKVLFSLPWLGYAVNYARTPAGLTVVIILATVVVYREILTIQKELLALWQKRRNERKMV